MIKGTSMNANQLRNLSGNGLLMTITISVVIIGAIFGLVAIGYEMTAFAAKPDGSGGSKNVIENSNGFPSGKHYNLHISGKGDNFIPDGCGEPGGNTIFTPLNSTDGAQDEDQTISMFVNKKKGLDHLVVRDHCTEAFDGSSGVVQLPDQLNDTTKITDGMWVFARVLGGPDRGSNDKDSNIILIPNPEIEACNLDDAGENATDCFDNNGNPKEFVNLGFVTKNGAYVGDPDGNGTKLYRYTTDDGETPAKGQGKGAKNAVDITGLFIWSGDACTDFDLDNQITIADFDANMNGTIDAGESGISLAQILEAEADAGSVSMPGHIDTDEELDALITILIRDDTAGCTHVDDTWVFNLFGADLVIQNHTIVNDGVSNTQIRFYPNQTTTFTP